jgi:hypothetical protein
LCLIAIQPITDPAAKPLDPLTRRIPIASSGLTSRSRGLINVVAGFPDDYRTIAEVKSDFALRSVCDRQVFARTGPGKVTTNKRSGEKSL